MNQEMKWIQMICLGPGPDPEYTDRVFKLGPQSVQLQYLYWDKYKAVAGASVRKEAMNLEFSKGPPHISLIKGDVAKGEDLGPMVRRGQLATDWRKCSPEINNSYKHDMWRMYLSDESIQPD